jgi:hypothetical protein
MTLDPQVEQEILQANAEGESRQKSASEKILCPHCRRTATNGIKCQGMCVADSGY